MTDERKETGLFWSDPRDANPIDDIKAMIEKTKNATGRVPEERPIVALWAYEYVDDHPTHEGCGGEWYPMGMHFWCSKCYQPLTKQRATASEGNATG